MPPQTIFRRLVPTYRVLFRLFYCCGTLLSEGCYLRRACVDLKNGYIKILQSKGNKDRLVLLADDVCAMCKTYDALMQDVAPNREWFFPGRHLDRAVRTTSVDKKFGGFWNKTPFATTVDKRPTVQSLRHTFVVNKMNEWAETGVDTAVMMPYFSRYLGHSSTIEIQYYFHTIERVFPIIRRYDAVSDSIIPEVVTTMRNNYRSVPLFFPMTYEFLQVYLPKQCGRSAHAVESYRDALSLFRRYILHTLGISSEPLRSSNVGGSACLASWTTSPS